ncbi:protein STRICTOSIDINE SYNTHASE-LIKE 5 isoform X2 [Hevea brasiliensis]|uniref:protein STRICTOSIDINE SYNTHASE-LIKE 5 isoform X2 n=1 Tax=Hevea brasiliensis TaxID=3981 RepID=UPI0025F508BE|nr:protein STRICTOSIDINE SYNTHASE-LIKE 5 isoform X2 [Hevea brasiliensis]
MNPPNNTARPISSRRASSCPFNAILFSVVAPVLAAVLLFHLDSFDPAPFPYHELTHPLPEPSLKNGRLLQGAEFLGFGELPGAEDIAYDSKSGVIYTTCEDGWIKRVTVNDSSVSDTVVENWVNTGGRPLGLVLGRDNDVIVADAYKGLLKISAEGAVELLTDEADGVKFKLADGVDIADDGIIYFTDASCKYYLHDVTWDFLEGKPNGRLLSYDPATKKTKVLLADLYFANGLAISPDQESLIYCETPMCKRYFIKGNKKGHTEKFVDMPGMPDNIHYDGGGHFWIASVSEITPFWKVAFRYPVIRKVARIVFKYIVNLRTQKNAGVFVVNLDGKLITHYHDPGLILISSGVKIGTHLYCGSVIYPYIIRLNLAEHPAHATT